MKERQRETTKEARFSSLSELEGLGEQVNCKAETKYHQNKKQVRKYHQRGQLYKDTDDR